MTRVVRGDRDVLAADAAPTQFAIRGAPTLPLSQNERAQSPVDPFVHAGQGARRLRKTEVCLPAHEELPQLRRNKDDAPAAGSSRNLSANMSETTILL